MEIKDSLLVAMMFIMILSIGIATVLAGLADTVRRPLGEIHWLPIVWMLLLLFYHLDLFWNSVLIIATEEWRFTGFLYMVLGPVLLFFASTVILSKTSEEVSVAAVQHYFEVSTYFFSVLALLMLWTIGADYRLRDGLSLISTQDVIQFFSFVALAFNKNLTLHKFITIFLCVVVLSIVIAHGAGFPS
jgi:hypothetical protein